MISECGFGNKLKAKILIFDCIASHILLFIEVWVPVQICWEPVEVNWYIFYKVLPYQY